MGTYKVQEKHDIGDLEIRSSAFGYVDLCRTVLGTSNQSKLQTAKVSNFIALYQSYK